ncbi:MAG: hypothetical protein HY858_04230 [Candidatus Solibacter usitatus]|nr:hypothetical protein [Candidatus Solibacter usitatus]
MSSRTRVRTTSTAHNRISPETSWTTRRLTAILISIWFGGILVVALAAPAAFKSVDSVLASPPAVTAKALKQLGPTAVREILHYQVGEANRLMFETWGIAQLLLGVSIFLLLLFLSTAGRPALGLALAMMLMAALMNFVLIPRISEIGRDMRASLQARPGETMQKFGLLHLGFTAFELAVVLLGTILLVLLLRNRSGFSGLRRAGGSRGGSGSGEV